MTDAPQRHLLLFSGLALAVFMFSVNQTMLSVALPTIVGELHGADQILWISASYMVAATVTLPAYGKLGDVLGLRRVFLVSLAIFVAACLLGSFSMSLPWLIAVRFVQGLGGGGLVVLAQAIIAAVIPPRSRGTYMGVAGAVMVLSTVAGPVLGGLITQHWGWRWCFGVNVPLGVLAWFLCVRFLRIPPSAHLTGAAHRDRRPLDVAGMVTLGVALTGVVLLSAWAGAGSGALTGPLPVATAAVSALALGAFVLVERRAADPVVPGYLVRDRNFLAATAAGLVLSLGTFGVTTYMPTYIQIVRGIDASAAGLVLLPMMVAVFLLSTGAGVLASRTRRYRGIIVAGGVLTAAGMLALGTADPDIPLLQLMGVLALVGAGIGAGSQLSVVVVQNSFPVSVVGTATATNQLFRNLGATLGISLVGSVFTARLVDGMGRDAPTVDYASVIPDTVTGMPPDLRDTVVHTYSDALIPVMLALAPLMVLAAVAALFISNHSTNPNEAEVAQ